MLHRQCEVRVCEARHLIPKQNRPHGDEKSRIAGLCVLLSHDGVHIPTEVCRDVETPTWERIATFRLNLRDSGRGAKDQVSVNPSPRTLPPPRGATGTAATASCDHWNGNNKSLNRVAKTLSRHPRGTTQSLNPFASNFVPPPEVQPHPLPPPLAAQLPLQTSLILHFRVLGDSMVAREVLGDVAVDLIPLMESRGDHLATDRLGHVDDKPLEGLPDHETLAVDTWVALRQESGELRVQILIKPGSPGGGTNYATTTRVGRPGNVNGPAKGMLRSSAPSSWTRIEEGDSRSVRYPVGVDESTWPAFNILAEAGLVKTSVSPQQRPLDDLLLEIQERYDFSASGGFRQGRPDDDIPQNKENGSGTRKPQSPEWPTSEESAAQLRGDMQFAELRNRRQCVAWAEQLRSSPGLQQVLRKPPPYGVLRRKREDTRRARDNLDVSTLRGLITQLESLVAQGIPSTLQRKHIVLDTATSGDERMGSAFEGSEERGFLDGALTSIPYVMVTRVVGSICQAEYHLQVKRDASGESWFVIRRYSDFVKFYGNLPRSFAAIAPPLPPKSWRSLSFLSMTPEFLEDRRVALEVALRRLTINALRADATVQAELRAFLGFPACPGASWLAGVDAEIVRHLVRMPSNLEVALPSPGLAPIPLLSNFRVSIWMLLSGAANKAIITDEREHYSNLVSVVGERDWCHRGGAVKDYSLAAEVFDTIDEDVNRTNVADSAERERVRRVLRAFALKNPSTGYCQGMNSVALFLLRTADEREDVTFWLLDALATTVIPGHWEKLSHISTADLGVVSIRTLLRDRRPQLLEHLDSRGLPPEVLACDFMLSLGCRALPPTSVLRILDLLFWEGGKTLHYITLAVLRVAEEELLSVQGASATSECLARRTSAMHDADTLIEIAQAEMMKSLRETGDGAMGRVDAQTGSSRGHQPT